VHVLVNKLLAFIIKPDTPIALNIYLFDLMHLFIFKLSQYAIIICRNVTVHYHVAKLLSRNLFLAERRRVSLGDATFCTASATGRWYCALDEIVMLSLICYC